MNNQPQDVKPCLVIKKVGFTGTQIGMSPNQKNQLRLKLLELYNQGATIFHHGDCVGADAQAHDIAFGIGMWIVIHPPSNPSKRAFKRGDETRAEADYLERNEDIVDETDYLIAAPKDHKVEERRSGTWATVRYAKRTGKPGLLLARLPRS
jgi:hypothetical protein